MPSWFGALVATSCVRVGRPKLLPARASRHASRGEDDRRARAPPSSAGRTRRPRRIVAAAVGEPSVQCGRRAPRLPFGFGRQPELQVGSDPATAVQDRAGVDAIEKTAGSVMWSHETLSTGRRGRAVQPTGFEPMTCVHSACVTWVVAMWNGRTSIGRRFVARRRRDTACRWFPAPAPSRSSCSPSSARQV